jgi:hypothetical protein
MQLRSPWLLLATLVSTLIAFAACGSVAPTPPATDVGVHASDPLVAARAFGVHDARIAKLLVPADPIKLAATVNADVKRGFDAARVSYGYRAGDNSAVALRMAADAAGTFYAGTGKDPRFQVALTPTAGALGTAQAEVRDGVITYREGYADTDVIVSAGRGAAEILYLLKSEVAPKDYAWKLQLPPGIAKVESRNDGLWLLDSAGDLVLHVPEPYAVDAVGVKRAALLAYDAERSEMRVTLTNDAGLTYPILLDPTFETEVWVEMQNPPASSGSQMIYDEARLQAVLFGGQIPLDETWVWDGLSWRRRIAGRADARVPARAVAAWDPERKQILAVGIGTAVWDGTSWQNVGGAQPPAQGYGNHTLTWDAERKHMLMMGGYNDSVLLGETWVYNSTGWNQLLPGPHPAKRGAHTVTWDPERKHLLLFGGFNAVAVFDDTWIHDGKVWTQLTKGVRPSPRLEHSVAWDAERKHLLLFGGGGDRGDIGVADTWKHDGTSWTQLTAGAGPAPRYAPQLMWNPLQKVILLAGGTGSTSTLGDTWTHDGTRWTQSSVGAQLSSRGGYAWAWETARQQFVLFGGMNRAPNSPNGIPLNDTWTNNGNGWTQPVPGTLPVPRREHSVNWDPERKQMLLFGGAMTSNRRFMYNDTWIHNGVSWRPLNTGPLPPPQWEAKVTWDDQSKHLLLLGWDIFNVSGTWKHDGSKWSQLTTGAQPRVRSGYSVTWDPERKQLLLLQEGPSNLLETWAHNGSVWARLPSSAEPPPAHAAVWDAERKKVLLYASKQPDMNGKIGHETWQHDGSGWTQLAPEVSQPNVWYGQTMSWDAERKHVLLFGGQKFIGDVGETWKHNGIVWTQLTTGGQPSARSGHTVTWDGERKQLVLFGGMAAGDTWRHDGNAWIPVTDRAATGPSARSGHTMTYDPVRKRQVLFGGSNDTTYFNDTWYLYLRGGGCSSGTECGSGFCTDGVCCEAAACGTCETCAGNNPGKCTQVINAEDADTCGAAQKKSCDARGACVPGLGAACTKGADCASGSCADGVCCDTACDRACEACSAKNKQGNRDDGRCGVASLGSNPGNRCLEGGVCSAAGTCDRGGACKDDRTAVDTKGNASDCGDYRCASGFCGKSCVNLNDCNAPAVCTQDGKCTRIGTANVAASGCCATAPGSHGTSGDTVAALAALSSLLIAVRARRRRAARAPTN